MEWIVCIGFIVFVIGLFYCLDKDGFDLVFIPVGFFVGIILYAIFGMMTSETGIGWAKTVTVCEYDFEYVGDNFVMWNDGTQSQVESLNKFEVRLGDEDKIEVIKTMNESNWFMDTEVIEYVIVIRKP